MSELLIVFAVLGTLPQPVDFDTEIVPVLTHAGCNGGSCHGGAAGRGGFRPSLLGANPRADYDAIVRELEGRRVDLARPDESLVYSKPTGFIDHGGDIRLEPFGAGSELILRWIRTGARRLQLPALTELVVTPAHHVADGTLARRDPLDRASLRMIRARWR